MKTTTLSCLLFFGSLNIALSQTEPNKNSSPILLSSLPLLGDGYEEVDLVLPEKGSYHFVLKEGIHCPEGYVIAIIDMANGNSFYLPGTETHYFTVSRPVNKHLRMCLRKTSDLPKLSVSLVVD